MRSQSDYRIDLKAELEIRHRTKKLTTSYRGNSNDRLKFSRCICKRCTRLQAEKGADRWVWRFAVHEAVHSQGPEVYLQAEGQALPA